MLLSVRAACPTDPSGAAFGRGPPATLSQGNPAPQPPPRQESQGPRLPLPHPQWFGSGAAGSQGRPLTRLLCPTIAEQCEEEGEAAAPRPTPHPRPPPCPGSQPQPHCALHSRSPSPSSPRAASANRRTLATNPHPGSTVWTARARASQLSRVNLEGRAVWTPPVSLSASVPVSLHLYVPVSPSIPALGP